MFNSLIILRKETRMKGDKGVGRTKGRGLEECFHEPLLYLLSMDNWGEEGGRGGGVNRAARPDRTVRSCVFYVLYRLVCRCF